MEKWVDAEGNSVVKENCFMSIRNYYRFLRGLLGNRLSLSMLRLLWWGGQNNVTLRDCCVINAGSNKIVIGKNCNLTGVRFYMADEGNTISIGEGTTINATKEQMTCINACGGRFVSIGKNCLISNNVEIHTSDYHKIINGNKQTNNPKDVIIGDHCWIGMQTLILKGSIIPRDTIVGAKTLINGEYFDTNTIIAGVPAKIVKSEVMWEK